MGEIVRFLPDKKKIRMAVQLSPLRGSRPKYARASPRQWAQRLLKISSKSVHFRPSYSRTREHLQNARKMNPIFGWSLPNNEMI